MKWKILSLILWLIPADPIAAGGITTSTGTVNVFIYNGPQSWTELTISTDSQTMKPSTGSISAVVLSSCAVVKPDPADCYSACFNSNGTLASSAVWMQCPK